MQLCYVKRRCSKTLKLRCEPQSLLVSPPLQDYDFVLKGLARLLVNPLMQTYLPNSTKKIQFHQELLVLFWKLCDFNKVIYNILLLYIIIILYIIIR